MALELTLICLIVAVIVIIHYNRETGKRSELIYYSRIASPVLLLPTSPYDHSFPDRVEEFQRKLKESGNEWNPPIICDPYLAPVGGEQTVNHDFELFILMQINHWRSVREQWAAERFDRAQEVATRKVAGFHILRSN